MEPRTVLYGTVLASTRKIAFRVGAELVSARKDMKKLPKRKNSLRLKGFDYSSEGSYFVTINCKESKRYFAKNNIREIVKSNIEKLNKHLSVLVDGYTIMENHLHLMITIKKRSKINLSNVIQSFKSLVTKELREKASIYNKIWQRGFYDHLIGNEKDYIEKMKYVMNNPSKSELGRR